MMSGGWQCGAVRHALTATPENAHLCHCRMGKKAGGGPFAAPAGGRLADLTWTRGAAARVPPVRRCGIESRVPWFDAAAIERLPGWIVALNAEGRAVTAASRRHPDHHAPDGWSS